MGKPAEPFRPVVCLAIAAAVIASGCQAPDTRAEVDPAARGTKASRAVETHSPAPTPTPVDPRPERQRRLGEELRVAVDRTEFDTVRGRSPMPNIDAAVIQLDAEGAPVAAANVLLSKDYPRGAVVPVDQDLGTSAVRWRHWTGDQWGSGRAVELPRAANQKPAETRLEFTSPYAASVLKLLVGFGILRLVDSGRIALDDSYTYRPSRTTSLCGGGGRTRTIRAWFEQMITVSDNQSTCALMMLLHRDGGDAELNETFADLGLTTLRIEGVEKSTGRSWRGITLTALDTARLLLIVSGAPGTLWTAPSGKPVTADVLSPRSRKFFVEVLAEQGLNQMLSTVNWCAREYPAPGIPQRVPDRWIGSGGKVTVGARNYGRDVRPCNARAEVTFAHKTGLVADAGGDAGIVRSIPEKPERRYVVVVFGNLGMSARDPDREAASADPPGTYPVSVTEKLARLGARIDQLMIAATARQR